MQVVRELRHVGVCLDQAVRELERMRRGEADALDARHGRDVMDERCEVDDRAVFHRARIGIHVLAEQRHLAHTLRGELADLGHRGFERAAHFIAARVGHDAEAAVLGAAFHHADERR